MSLIGLTKSTCGKDAIIDNNYHKYTFNSTGKNVNYWTCANRSCKARISTSSSTVELVYSIRILFDDTSQKLQNQSCTPVCENQSCQKNRQISRQTDRKFDFLGHSIGSTSQLRSIAKLTAKKLKLLLKSYLLLLNSQNKANVERFNKFQAAKYLECDKSLLRYILLVVTVTKFGNIPY